MPDFTQNPLYQPPAMPDFARIQPQDVVAIEAIIKENRAQIEALLAQETFTWENLIQPLERMDNRLSKAFSPIAHLFQVNSTEAWREAYEKALPILSEYESDIGQNTKLYQAIKSIKEGAEFAILSAGKQKAITDSLESFERSGVALPEDKKAEYKAIKLKLSALSTKFGNNVLDATNAWSYLLEDDARLKGVPDSAKAVMADLAKQHEQQGYRLTLDAPVVIPILTYADDRDLRALVYKAYNGRASDLTDNGKYDNAALIKEILELRHQCARLLGYPDYAALSVADKMAKTEQTVLDFLEDLLEKSKPAGERDMQELSDFAAKELGLSDLQPWDVGYASEKLRQQKYAISDEDLRPYFPISKVLEGMFAITKTLYGVSFRANTKMSVWHKDVRAFDVLDADGNLQAHFYLDPYARQKKRGGAWMDGAASRFLDNGKLQLPVAYLVCNFTPPVGDDEAYLTHDEVTTLFHEFGHGLHHMLTKVDVFSISGINGVEWDAVEQPSQFNENFCFDKTCLAMMTAKKGTGEPLPDELYKKMIAAKNFHAAMAMLRQLEFAIFDFRLHTQAEYGKDVLDVLHRVQQHVAVTPIYEKNRFPMQFSHIFAGGYDAGYYSYKWAEVLSADSFGAFLEEGVLNPKTGARFRDEILAVGASRPSMESFIAFRGRKPSVDALLTQNGIL